MSRPYEVIAAPFTAWVAPIGTAFPLIDAAPAVEWFKIGTSGNLNYTRDGVVVSHSQTIVKWRSLGDTGSRKAFRTEEDFKIKLMLADMTLEQLARAINNNAVTTVAPGGEAGYKSLGLSRGPVIEEQALLLRGPSPEDEDLNMQYEVPRAVHVGSPELTFQLETPANYPMEWDALVDPDAATPAERFGRLIASHLAALS